MFSDRYVVPADELTGMRIHAFNKVGGLAEVPHILDLQRRLADIAIVDVDIAALVGMHGIVLAAAIDHHELTDGTIEIPAVVGNFLKVRL